MKTGRSRDTAVHPISSLSALIDWRSCYKLFKSCASRRYSVQTPPLNKNNVFFFPTSAGTTTRLVVSQHGSDEKQTESAPDPRPQRLFVGPSSSLRSERARAGRGWLRLRRSSSSARCQDRTGAATSTTAPAHQARHQGGSYETRWVQCYVNFTFSPTRMYSESCIVRGMHAHPKLRIIKSRKYNFFKLASNIIYQFKKIPLKFRFLYSIRLIILENVSFSQLS